MSADGNEKFAFKEERKVFQCCEGNLSFSTTNSTVGAAFHEDDCNRKKDPTSHRIIEKRRRDRMNNCLADLSRLIPPEYLKRGRGRIEKTEIIEMAIKYMEHLLGVISSARFNENSNGSVLSPQAVTSGSSGKEFPSSLAPSQPLTVRHYRMGYLDCMSEAINFLVEVRGYFAGDSLCVELINHLRRHCDKLLKENTFDFHRKPAYSSSGDSSASLIPGNGDGSPPPRTSGSNGSVSDENPCFRPEVKFASDPWCDSKRTSEFYYCPTGCTGPERENRTDFERRSNPFVANGASDLAGEVESKNFCQRNDRLHSGDHEEPGSRRDAVLAKEGNGKIEIPLPDRDSSMEDSFRESQLLLGSSQLRQMLTSLASVSMTRSNDRFEKNETEVKWCDPSPSSNGSENEVSYGANNAFKKRFKLADSTNANLMEEDGGDSRDRNVMYKFKTKINQRFSKEREEMAESDPLEVDGSIVSAGRSPEEWKTRDDSLAVVRLTASKEEVDETLGKRGEGIISGNIREPNRWEEPNRDFQFKIDEKSWASNPSLPCWNSQAGLEHHYPPSPLPLEPFYLHYASSATNGRPPFRDSPESPRKGIPIFALHAKGSFYVPLTLDQAILAPFLHVLGMAKGNEEPEERTVLHPVTISVDFQPRLVRFEEANSFVTLC